MLVRSHGAYATEVSVGTGLGMALAAKWTNVCKPGAGLWPEGSFQESASAGLR